MYGFIRSFSMRRMTGTGQGLSSFCQDICTWMKDGREEGAGSGGGVIDARLLQSDWDPVVCNSGVPRCDISWRTKNKSSYTTFVSFRMLTFISFTGISQLLETTTNLLWRPSLACSFIYIIWYESIPHGKASRLLSFWSDCFLLVFFQRYRGVLLKFLIRSSK